MMNNEGNDMYPTLFTYYNLAYVMHFNNYN
ncbi:Uncharacterised protein [Klebsiella quasipneumoniae]|nr:Uncharacterised protein [Klebsiella quasipneumoniae]